MRAPMGCWVPAQDLGVRGGGGVKEGRRQSSDALGAVEASRRASGGRPPRVTDMSRGCCLFRSFSEALRVSSDQQVWQEGLCNQGSAWGSCVPSPAGLPC